MVKNNLPSGVSSTRSTDLGAYRGANYGLSIPSSSLYGNNLGAKNTEVSPGLPYRPNTSSLQSRMETERLGASRSMLSPSYHVPSFYEMIGVDPNTSDGTLRQYMFEEELHKKQRYGGSQSPIVVINYILPDANYKDKPDKKKYSN